MFYRMYLSNLCHRRQWPDPAYEPQSTRNGCYCKVRVNNREYSTDVPYESEDLARDGAAMKAFMICRNFSSNDGMMPGARPGQTTSNGVVQGLPVAIGTGRRSNRSSASSYESESSSLCDGTTSSSSSGTSPRSLDGVFEQQMQRPVPRPIAAPAGKPARRNPGNPGMPRHQHHSHHHHNHQSHHSHHHQPAASSIVNLRGPTAPAALRMAAPPVAPDEYYCLCRRALVHLYGRCALCLRESGWA